MPVHDWTLVDAGIFHDFHNAWITELRNALNCGLLPEGYYALGEQHAGRFIGDVLTLHANPTDELSPPLPPATGGILLAEAPPQVQRRLTAAESYRQRRRSLAIRHVSGHRLVALVEIVSPGNKDRREHVDDFVNKVVETLERGVHVLLVDLFPPRGHDPNGMHAAVWNQFDEECHEAPDQNRLTLASYNAGPPLEAFVEHFVPGQALAAMPLFLRPDRYVLTPLEESYAAAYRGVPAYWQHRLEGRCAD